MTMSSQPNRPTTQSRCSKATAGVVKHYAGVANLTLPGGTWTPTDIEATLRAPIDALNTAHTTKATWQQAVKTGSATKSKALALLAALKAYLVAIHGNGAVDLLADFGFAPAKPRKVTVRSKVTAVDKTHATRVARHTMGKKQRKLVKGTVASPQPAPPAWA